MPPRARVVPNPAPRRFEMLSKVRFGLLFTAFCPLVLTVLNPFSQTTQYQMVIDKDPAARPLMQPVVVNVQTENGYQEYYPDFETRVPARLRLVVPSSHQLVVEAIDSLANGWDGMTRSEQYYFQLFFDPGQTGDIDEAFIAEVAGLYQRIEAEFSQPLTLAFETENRLCVGDRLYYHLLGTIHVCPRFATMPDTRFMEIGLVHELAHQSTFMFDRPYYAPDSAEYQALRPRGSWRSELPVVGPILRELERGDTLFHPDAYAWYAAMVHLVNNRVDERTGQDSPALQEKVQLAGNR